MEHMEVGHALQTIIKQYAMIIGVIYKVSLLPHWESERSHKISHNKC